MEGIMRTSAAVLGFSILVLGLNASPGYA